MRFPVSAVAAVLWCFSSFFWASAQAPSGADVLESLRRSDERVLDGGTLHSVITMPRMFSPMGQTESEQLIYRNRLTKSGERWASESVIDPSVGPPRYIAPTPNSGINYYGAELINFRTERSLRYCEAGFKGMYELTIHYRVHPGNRVTRFWSPQNTTGEVPIVWLDKPERPLGDFQVFLPLLASGHGFGYYLDAVSDVSVDGDTTFVRGRGDFGTVPDVEWKLEIESASGLVRKAAGYVVNYPDDPYVEFVVEGSHAFERGVLPERGSVSLGLGPNPVVWEVRYETLDGVAAVDILDEGKARLTAESFPPGTDLRDARHADEGFERTIVPYETASAR